MVSTVMKAFADRTQASVKRWGTTLDVPVEADDARAGTLIQGALIRAAKAAAAFDKGPFHPQDHSWTHDGMRGLSRERIADEMVLADDLMSPGTEEWGIMARVVCDGLWFDVPIAMDLNPDSARNILARMEGWEGRFVDVDLLGRVMEGKPATIRFHADNWAQLRELAAKGDMTMLEAMDFRRPVVWDLLRAELSDLPPEPLTPFSEEEFYTRFAKSARYDASLMLTNRGLVHPVSRLKVEPLSVAWSEWHPAVVDLLNMIGVPQVMEGISIILSFSVEEPCAVDGRDADGEAVSRWAAVSLHNMAVCYGLHPLSAVHVLDFVRRNAASFFDIPTEENRRFVMKGVSAIPDALLSAYRVSLHGRTGAYDAMVAVGQTER